MNLPLKFIHLCARITLMK